MFLGKPIKEFIEILIKNHTVLKRIDKIKSEPNPGFGEVDPFEGEGSIIGRKKYESEKYQLQIELLKLQEWVVKNGAI